MGFEIQLNILHLFFNLICSVPYTFSFQSLVIIYNKDHKDWHSCQNIMMRTNGPRQANLVLINRVKRIWYLSTMRAAKVQASLRIRTVSPEPSLFAHTSSESRGTFRQKARSLAPLNGWACEVKIYHDGMLEDTNSLDGAQISTVSDSNAP